MDTLKKTICNKVTTDKRSLQFTLDKDINVPEQLGDISSIVTKNGNLAITEEKNTGDKLYISGNLFYQLLYYTDEDDPQLTGLNGSIDFDEMVRIDEQSKGTWTVNAKLEDIQISIVHPRKISVNALITLNPVCSLSEETQVITSIENDEAVECYYEDTDLTTVFYSENNKITINEDLPLDKSAPNLSEILYYSYVLSDYDCECDNEGCSIFGKLGLFVVYTGEDDGRPYHILQEEIPFEKQIEVSSSDNGCILFSNPYINKVRLNIKADEDGEQRIISVLAEIDCQNNMYREEKTLLLDDAYTTSGELLISKEPKNIIDSLSLETKIIKLTEKLSGDFLSDNLGEIIHTEASIDIDDMSCSEDGLHVAGTVYFNAFNKDSSTSEKINVISKDFDFMETLPLNGLDDILPENININLTAIPLDTSVKALSGGDLELRLDIKFTYLATSSSLKDFITDMVLSPCCQRCKKQITCYFIKEGDTIFSIGKHYKVKTSDIEKWNQEISLSPGNKLFMYTCRQE